MPFAVGCFDESHLNGFARLVQLLYLLLLPTLLVDGKYASEASTEILLIPLLVKQILADTTVHLTCAYTYSHVACCDTLSEASNISSACCLMLKRYRTNWCLQQDIL